MSGKGLRLKSNGNRCYFIPYILDLPMRCIGKFPPLFSKLISITESKPDRNKKIFTHPMLTPTAFWVKHTNWKKLFLL